MIRKGPQLNRVTASTPKDAFELASLPTLFSTSSWTVYLDDVPQMDTKGLCCIPKWLGDVSSDQAIIVNVRPDGYVGSIRRWHIAERTSGEAAARWLDDYYGGFLEVPSRL